MDMDLALSTTSTTSTTQIVAINNQSQIKKAMISSKIELHPVFRESATFESN